jgi:hypothetical protein
MLAVWYILWPFGNLEEIWNIFFPFWYILSRKIWQPLKGFCTCTLGSKPLLGRTYSLQIVRFGISKNQNMFNFIFRLNSGGIRNHDFMVRETGFKLFNFFPIEQCYFY